MSTSSSTDNATRQLAQNWINTATKSNQWRLQILSRKYRIDPTTGKQVETPTRIRRFLEGCPPAYLKEVIDILLEKAPYTGVLYNGNLISGTFRPTNTEWRRDDQTVVNGLQKTDGTYTLIQDLIDQSLSEQFYGKTSDNCTEEVLSKYVWDSPTIEALPVPSQGVTYAIQQVNRSEDGTYNYVLVKRTAKTQLNSESVTGDNEFETTYSRVYRNLYGTPDSPKDNSGTSVTLASPSSAVDGETIERTVQPNEDCTFNVTVQRKVSKSITSERSTAKTIEEHEVSQVKRSQSTGLADAPAAANGVIKKHKNELRPDGKYDTTETTTTEQSVVDSTVRVTVTRKGTRTTHVSKNQATAASTTGLSTGTEVTVEKTPGGLHNNTVTTWSQPTPQKVAEKCQTDLFSHTDEATNSGGTMPGPDDHITGGGVGGHVKSRTTSIDDDTGVVIQTVTDKQELPVAMSLRRWTTTTKGTTYEERNTNQSTVPTHSGAVGSVTTIEKTEGGLYTYSVKQFSAALSGNIGTECSKTIFTHIDRTLTVETGPYSGHVPAASGGVTTSVSSRKNDEGGYDQSVETRTDLPVSNASTETTVTLHGRRVTTVHRNMSAAATGSGNIGSSVKNEKTDSGLYNQTIVETSTDPVGTIREDCSQTGSEHRHSTVANVTTMPTVEQGSVSPGTIVEKSVSKTEYATYDVTTVNRTAKAQSHNVVFGNSVQHTSQTAYKNASSVSVTYGGTNVETRASLSKNDFQLLDGTVSTTTYVPQTLGPLVSGNSHTQVELTFGKNVTSVSGKRGGVNEDCSMSASANDHGSYDYTLRTTKYVSVGPVTVGSVTGQRKSTVIRFAKNNLTAPNETASTNEEISVSATMNDHGSYDWTSRKDTYHPYGPVTIATSTGTLKSTTVTSAYNQVNVTAQTARQNEDISVSASMNSHGSFDWTARKDTYHPYGPITLATASGQFKTTTITSAYNQTTVSQQSAGSNEDISMSASMNSHGSFDWTCRKDKYNPYGPVTVGTVDGTFKNTVIKSAFNQTSVAAETAGTNEDLSVSASLNSHGSIDWTSRKDTYKPYGPVTVAQTSGSFKTTTITSAFNQTTMRSQTAGQNEELSVSASLNSHGSIDWTCRKDTYQPYGPQQVATTSSPVMTTTHYIGLNNTSVSSNASGNASSTMSVSMNSRGTFDTHEIVRTPQEKSLQTTFTTGSGNSLKTHTILVYRNSSDIKTLNGDSSASAGASINEFGLVDGSASSVSGGSSGGNHFTHQNTVKTYIYFTSGGGVPRKREVTATCTVKSDTVSIVSSAVAGGLSFGSWVSTLKSVDLGNDRALGVIYSNLQFGNVTDA